MRIELKPEDAQLRLARHAFGDAEPPLPFTEVHRHAQHHVESAPGDIDPDEGPDGEDRLLYHRLARGPGGRALAEQHVAHAEMVALRKIVGVVQPKQLMDDCDEYYRRQ